MFLVNSGEQCSVLCFNGGTCNKDVCICKNGFTGKFCQSRKFLLESVDVCAPLAGDRKGELTGTVVQPTNR